MARPYRQAVAGACCWNVLLGAAAMEYSELIDLVRARAGLSNTGEARTAVVTTLEGIFRTPV